jgi:hypothetical protein
MVITNNPLLEDARGVEFVEGGFRDVLVRVRDLTYLGHELISHPLFASLGMMFSPYRSVIVSDRPQGFSPEQAQLAEDSIASFDLATQGRRRIGRNDADYARMDLELLEAALEECGEAGGRVGLCASRA